MSPVRIPVLLAAALLLLSAPLCRAASQEVACSQVSFHVAALPGLPEEGFQCYRQTAAADGTLTRLLAVQWRESHLLQAHMTVAAAGTRLHRVKVEEMRLVLEQQDSWFGEATWSPPQDLGVGSYMTVHRGGRSCFLFDALTRDETALRFVVYCEPSQAPLSDSRVTEILAAIEFPTV